MKVGRAEDGSIYHYTSASTFLNLIAPYGRLRLSKFANSIDPREKLGINLGLSLRSDAQEDGHGGDWLRHLETLKEMCRDNAQMLCFANSYAPLFPARQFDSEGDRGWAHGAMWAHFADRSAGVCLEIDKQIFIEDFEDSTEGVAVGLQGDVIYMGADDMRIAIPNMSVESVQEATADRMLAHVVHNSISTFFQKDSCWSYENEFRVAAINACGEPIYVPIRRSLKRVIVGGEFAEQLLPVLEWVVRNAGLEASVQAIDWWGMFASPPRRIDVPEDADEKLIPFPPQIRGATHSHEAGCCPSVAANVAPEDQISRWRSMIFRAYRRRLSRALEEVSAVFNRTFSREPKYMAYLDNDETLSLEVDRYLLAADVLSVETPWTLQSESFELRFAIAGDSSSRAHNLVRIESVGHDGVHHAKVWRIQDADADVQVLRCLREFDDFINCSLLASFGGEFEGRHMISGIDPLGA